MSKYLFAAAAAVSTLLATSAMAGTVSGSSFQVSVSVNAGCSISSDLSAVTFAATAGTAAVPGSQSSSASIICTKGTPYDFHMTTANGFKMVFGAYNIPYTISGPNGVVGSTAKAAASFGSTGTGVAQPAAFTFAIPAASWSPTNAPGTYTDTVTMNVDF